MTEHTEKIDEASNYLTHLIQNLGNSYDLLYSQNLDLKALGEAVDALIFANNRLQEQKPILEERLSQLRAGEVLDKISS